MDPSLGATIFGRHAAGYQAARPDYPAEIYEILSRLGLGNRCLEIGAGTGIATRPLQAAGFRVTAVEPDGAMAAALPSEVPVIAERFEQAQIGGPYDLICAATSFHWLDGPSSLRKIHGALAEGGCFAMWWTVFGDPRDPDAFMQASAPLFAGLATSPSQGLKLPFALEVEARLSDLRHAGFRRLSYHEIAWEMEMGVQQTVGLTASFSPVAQLPDHERQAFLRAIAALVEGKGGVIRRRFLTPLYLARP